MDVMQFTQIFVGAVAINILLQLWLKTRHIRHISAHREAVPVAYVGSIDLEQHQKAADYSIAKARYARLALVWESALLIAFTLGGGIAWLDNVSRSMLGDGIAGGLGLFALLGLANGLLDLPFSLYQTFVLETRFGFNKVTPALFVTDLIKGTLLGAAIGLPLLSVVLWLMSQAGSTWWIWTWGVWTGFGLLMMAIYPKWIAPIFNKFSPLEDASLKTRIDALLVKCGFQSNGVFLMDGSKRSSHGNAYFTGFGKTKRIVFFDTLIERLTPVEIEAVLAHELGHFACKHIVQRMVVSYVLGFVVLALMGWMKDASWFYAALGVPHPSTAAALVLFFLALPVFTFPFGWIGSFMSRKHEFEADAFAVAHSDGAALESGLIKLYRDNASTLTPDPLHSLFYDSHPPASLRIAALRGSKQ
ncbi:M48 family metallopeptidase [Burkholderiaceae bacterium DAT-1]|nr:M48 family metallopeptidase [Burkholderiaceae bacterium DAT-1]